jgi:hypothetical protein
VRDVTALQIGGVEDHVHMLIGMPPTLALSDVVKRIKGESSKWLSKEKGGLGRFRMAGWLWRVHRREVTDPRHDPIYPDSAGTSSAGHIRGRVSEIPSRPRHRGRGEIHLWIASTPRTHHQTTTPPDPYRRVATTDGSRGLQSTDPRRQESCRVATPEPHPR